MKLLFVHGSGGTEADFYYQTRYFKDSEAVTLPGHPHGKPCSSISGYVDWLRGYIAGNGYEDVVLAGHSMGGGIVLLYGLLYPDEVKALVPISSGARLRVHPEYLADDHDGITDPEAWARDRRERPATYDSSVHTMVLEKELEVGPAVHHNDMTACDHFDIMDRVGEIKLPTLAICGTEDVMTPPIYSRYLEEHMDSCRTVIVEGATHSIMLERPDLVNRAIEDFLASLS